MIEELNIRQVEEGPKKGLAKITIICDDAYSKLIMEFANQLMSVGQATKDVLSGLSRLAGAVKK